MKINNKVKINLISSSIPDTIKTKCHNRQGTIIAIKVNSLGKLIYFLDIVDDFYFYENEIISLKKKKNHLPKWF